MKKVFALALALVLLASPAFAFQCEVSQALYGGSVCKQQVYLTSSETTLVSEGTVLVYNLDASSPGQGAYEVEVGDASADGVFVAGIAQGRIASGETGYILVRGESLVAINDSDTITSGTALWVSVSGDAGITTSTTQNQLGYALNANTSVDTNARTTIEAFVTIV